MSKQITKGDYSLAPIVPIIVDGTTAIGGYGLVGVCRGHSSDVHGNNGPIALGIKDGNIAWLLVGKDHLESLAKTVEVIECPECLMIREYDRFIPEQYH